MRVAVLAFLATCAASAYAQDAAYPTRPVHWVVPFPAGTPVDAVTRKVANGVSSRLGVAIVIENKTGAGGSIGTTDVANATPDGYRVLVASGDPLINNTALYRSVTYDPLRDFAMVSKIAQSSGALLIANPDVDARGLMELVERSRSMPEGYSYGSSGVGSMAHLVMLGLAQRTGAKLVHVPYRGSPEAVQNMVARHISMSLTGVMVAAPLIADKKAVPLAITGNKRSLLMPDVPTFVELGFDDVIFRSALWIGMAAPKGAPKAAIDRLAGAIRDELRTPEMQQFATQINYEIIGSSPEEFSADFAQEFDLVTKFIRTLGIEMQ